MTYDVGGMGLGPGSQELVDVPLDVSSDLQNVIERYQYRNPLSPTLAPFVDNTSFRAPLDTSNALVKPPVTTSSPASNFDLTFGDSIAAQQGYSDIPGVGNRRIWGYSTPMQYNANNPAPFESVWHTAEVGAPPQRILERAKYLLSQNPDYFRGKNMFLTIGSNDPSQLDATKELFGLLNNAGVGNVVVPGMGPSVRDSQVMNAALKSAVEGAGSNFSFFQPDIRWARDGVHPANSQQMYDQANATLSKMEPAAPSVAEPGGMQRGEALQPPTSPPINPLVPMPPVGRQPIYPIWGGYVREKEGFLPSIGNDVGYPSIGYGHLVTQKEQAQGYIEGVDADGNRVRYNLTPGQGGAFPSMNITRDQGEDIFRKDIGESLDAWRKEIPGFDKLTPMQQEALASYHYNTGHTIPGMADAIKAGDFNRAAELLRGGIATVHGQPNAGLATRREQEAQMMLGNEVPAYGYKSGQRVPGTGYTVGGRAVPRVPSQGTLGAPTTTALPDVVNPNPLAPTTNPAQAMVDMNERDRQMRALQMWGMLGGMMKGMQFKAMPINYDPFKVKEAGDSEVPRYEGGMAHLGIGPIGYNPAPAPRFETSLLPISRADYTRALPEPRPIGVPARPRDFRGIES